MQVRDVEVLVVGGGIMGVCAAYFLRQSGHEVVVVERKTVGAESSGRNAGSIALQNKRLHLIPLCKKGIETWRELDREVDGLEFTSSGGLRVAETPDDVRILDQVLPLQNKLGLDVQRLSTEEVRAMAPYLSDSLMAANYCSWDSFVDALRSTERIAAEAEGHGVEFICRSTVRDLRWLNAQRVEADVGETTFRCRILVLATGAWTERMAGLLGAFIPIVVRMNQMIVTSRIPRFVHHMISHARGILTLKQVSCGSVLIGGGWQGHGCLELDEVRPALDSVIGNANVAVRVVPALGDMEVIRTWGGFDSRTEDEYPVIGSLVGKKNVLVGTSCIGGYVAGPYVGRLLAQLVHEGKSEMKLESFSPGRFD